MIHGEMVNLIRMGIPADGGVWADFGAGAGNFTRALADLVGSTATLYAVDRDDRALRQLRLSTWAQALPNLHVLDADFTQPLELPPLDGLLVANALHWVRQQEGTLRLLVDYLKPGGVIVVVEYDVALPRGYIPYPLPYPRFESLAHSVGLGTVWRVGERQSPSSGEVMYAGAARR